MRIFVVDDHRDIAEGLADVLRLHGHEVEVAFNGEQAIRIFREQDFDIAFMDVMMPGMNGVESFLEIRKIKPDAKVIMMTGYSVEQLLDQAIENGAYGVLHKPVGMDDVLEALERVNSQGMVLVADDDPDFAGNIKEVLEKHGYRVSRARTGKQALDTALAGGIDILILDLQLPVISGLEVYMQLQQRGRALPTIVVTGYDDAHVEALDSLRSLSATGILTKPFDSGQLLDALGSIMPGGKSGTAKTAEAPQAAPPAARQAPAAPKAETAPPPKAVSQPPRAASTAPTPGPAPQPKPTAAPAPSPAARPEASPAPTASPAPAPTPSPAPMTSRPPAPTSPPASAPQPSRPPQPVKAPQPEASPAPAASAKPGAPAPMDSLGSRTSSTTLSRRGRILAVDDDVDMVEGLAEVLDTHGYTVKTANNAEDAKKLIQEFDAQVALLDIRLGKTNGLDLISILKEYRPNIFCVVITGNADKESAITALRNGAYDYMTKPLHPNELFSILDRCLDKFRLEQETQAAFEALQIAKDAAEAATKSQGEFLTTMSKELRSPVNTIIGSSNILIDEAMPKLGEDRYVEHAKAIREGATRLLGIISYAHDLAKAKVGRLELNEEKVDINNLVSTVMRLVQRTMSADDLEMEIEMPENPPMIWGDERQLKQILLNLLTNAVKFTPDKGKIKLTMRQDDDGSFNIEVCDTGIGMAPGDIPKALEQFGRIDSQACRDFQGTGLGLPFVVTMAELHGGKLELESELGKGTAATVTLPAERVIAARPPSGDTAVGSAA